MGLLGDWKRVFNSEKMGLDSKKLMILFPHDVEMNSSIIQSLRVVLMKEKMLTYVQDGVENGNFYQKVVGGHPCFILMAESDEIRELVSKYVSFFGFELYCLDLVPIKRNTRVIVDSVQSFITTIE
eukprot:TRINITY_DN10839_c0_g1_i1.p1 TRINITY_DN10839_c0_g1~~TRINITY_DN10839_c0_g1_i1.p1  ORF type:complete len:126 (+),score=12.25 TRINITY_DN10839_c0_g1_i1:171-548(+)